MIQEVIAEGKDPSPPLSLCDEISVLYSIINQPCPTCKGFPTPEHEAAYLSWMSAIAKARVALLKRIPDIIDALSTKEDCSYE